MSTRKLSHIRDVVTTTAPGPGPVQPPYDDQPIKQDLAQTKARVGVLENKQTNDRNDINANKQHLITMQLEVDKIAGIDNKLTTVEGIANSNASNFAQLQPFLTNRVALKDRDNNFTVNQSGQTPTQDNHLATKKYVDDKVAGGGPVNPPYDDRPIKQEIQQLKDKDQALEASTTANEQSITALQQADVTINQSIADVTNKVTTNQQSITALQQEDTRLQQEIDKTNAKVATVEQTANEANQKANANEQAISDVENEVNALKPNVNKIPNIEATLTNVENKADTNAQKITTLENQQQTNNIAINDLGTRIDNLDRDVAKTNQDNEFTGTQTFEFAKVKRVPGNNQFEIVNWGVFNTRTTNIEDRVTALENAPPGGGGQPPFDPTPLEQEDVRLQQEINNLNNIVPKLNQDNTFRGTQTFEFAKVERVPGNHQHEVVNWGVFNTRASRIEDRVRALEQRPPGGGVPNPPPFDPTPLQNEDRRLQGEIDKSNQKIADNLQEITAIKQKDVIQDNKIQQIEQKNIQQENQIQQIEQKNNQQDSILRNAPRLNGINQFTDTNTFQRLRCKSPATGDEEVVRQKEFNAEVRRLEGLIPPGGGGGGTITTNQDSCVVLNFNINETRRLVQTWNAGTGGLYFAKSSRYTFNIPKHNLIPVFERLATPQEKAQGQDVQVNVNPVTVTFHQTTTQDFLSGVSFSSTPNNPFVNSTGGLVNIVIDRITGMVSNDLSPFNKWNVYITVVISRRN